MSRSFPYASIFPRASSWIAASWAAACGALLAVLVGCGEEKAPPELPPRAIQWQRVSAATAVDRRVISGIVTAVADTTLAFEVGGTVKSVAVNLGDRVERGQELARLDPEPLELTVRDAEAAVAEARALREQARASLERFEEAAPSGAIAKQELDRARTLLDARQGQLEAAEARLGLARRDLLRSVLRAPFPGSISAREIEPAMTVATGQPAFELDGEDEGLRVEVQMPETLIARVRQGDAVEVRFPAKHDAPGAGEQGFAARVAEVGSRAGSGNAFPVRADLEEAPAGLKPGMTAEVVFSLPRRESGLAGVEGFMIPIAATLPEADDRFSVFVYDSATSTVRKRAITPGGVGDDVIAVLDGLEEGDVIATAGVPFLRDGQEVTLLDERLLRRAP